MLNNILKKEWYFVALISIIVILLTTAPFIYGYLNAPIDKYFLGFHSLAPGDYSVYYSYILQAYDGSLLLQDLYTGESIKNSILNTHWIFVGIFGRVLNLSPYLSFHITRIILIPVLLGVLYVFASFYFHKIKTRKIILIFFAFSTGISGYFLPFFEKIYYESSGYFHKPFDLWVAESNIFLSTLHSGHMIMATILTAIIFIFTLLFAERKKYRYSIFSGLGALWLFSFYPFHMPVIFSILLVFFFLLCLKNKRAEYQLFFHILIIFLLTLPVIIYYFIMLTTDSIMIQRAIQNINLSPAWYFLFFSYGFLLLFSLYAFIVIIKKKRQYNTKLLFLYAWIIVQFVLLYLPFHFQRRMVLGLQIPLIFLAVVGVMALLERLKKKFHSKTTVFLFTEKIILMYFVILLFCASNLVVLGKNFSLYYIHSPFMYYQLKEIQAMRWFQDNVNENDLILSHATSGYIIPGVTGKRVFIGHQVETIFYERKMSEVAHFFSENMSDNERKGFLKNNMITHIYYGGLEKSYGNADLHSKKYLDLVYNNDVQIYRFSPHPSPLPKGERE